MGVVIQVNQGLQDLLWSHVIGLREVLPAIEPFLVHRHFRVPIGPVQGPRRSSLDPHRSIPRQPGSRVWDGDGRGHVHGRRLNGV